MSQSSALDTPFNVEDLPLLPHDLLMNHPDVVTARSALDLLQKQFHESDKALAVAQARLLHVQETLKLWESAYPIAAWFGRVFPCLVPSMGKRLMEQERYWEEQRFFFFQQSKEDSERYHHAKRMYEVHLRGSSAYEAFREAQRQWAKYDAAPVAT